MSTPYGTPTDPPDATHGAPQSAPQDGPHDGPQDTQGEELATVHYLTGTARTDNTSPAPDGNPAGEPVTRDVLSDAAREVFLAKLREQGTRVLHAA